MGHQYLTEDEEAPVVADILEEAGAEEDIAQAKVCVNFNAVSLEGLRFLKAIRKLLLLLRPHDRHHLYRRTFLQVLETPEIDTKTEITIHQLLTG